MRLVMFALLIAACAEHGKGGGPANDPPAECASHCIIDHPVNSFEDCCDSITCFFDSQTDQWQVVACDPPPPDPCASCTADQLCVQSYDGTCGLGTSCVPRTVECPANACSADCEAAYCNAPFQCQNREPCGSESPLAFTCYGP